MAPPKAERSPARGSVTDTLTAHQRHNDDATSRAGWRAIDASRRECGRWFADQERRQRERRGRLDPRRLRRLAADWTARYGEDEAEKMLRIVDALAEVRR